MKLNTCLIKTTSEDTDHCSSRISRVATNHNNILRPVSKHPQSNRAMSAFPCYSYDYQMTNKMRRPSTRHHRILDCGSWNASRLPRDKCGNASSHQGRGDNTDTLIRKRGYFRRHPRGRTSLSPSPRCSLPIHRHALLGILLTGTSLLCRLWRSMAGKARMVPRSELLQFSHLPHRPTLLQLSIHLRNRSSQCT